MVVVERAGRRERVRVVAVGGVLRPAGVRAALSASRGVDCVHP